MQQGQEDSQQEWMVWEDSQQEEIVQEGSQQEGMLQGRAPVAMVGVGVDIVRVLVDDKKGLKLFENKQSLY